MFTFADEEDILIVVFYKEIRERVHVMCVHGCDCLIEVIFGSIFKDFFDHEFVPQCVADEVVEFECQVDCDDC